jgi:hypothetical protein
MRPHDGGHKAAEREEALKEAEGLVVRPGPDDEKMLQLKLFEIETHPVLFQPRAFLETRADRQQAVTDPEHVKDLETRIKLKGELKPMTVIKLGTEWTIIDGHHRLAAYKNCGWKKPLKCWWFDGSARQAMDEAASSSTEVKLTASRADRDEMAWQRVLIGGWRREDIRKLCCISPNLVTRMNDVVEWYNDKTVKTKERYDLRRLEPDLKKVSWMQANLAYLGASAEEQSDEERAQTLARRMRERFDGKHSLSRNPKITAMALERYDRQLPGQLQEAWGAGKSAAMKAQEAHNALDEEQEKHTDQDVSLKNHDSVLLRQAEKLRAQAQNCEAKAQRLEDELARRKGGGTPSDHAWSETTGKAVWRPSTPEAG